MDPSTPPPWRVFDAPATPTASPEAGAAPPSAATALRAGLAQAVRDGRLAIAGGLAVAAGALVVAAVFATGAIGGDVTLDALGGHPLGSGAASSAAGGTGGQLVVDVAGAVLRPGVYRLDAGARIGDAIAAAGGYSPRVAADVVARTVNLAALVHDGDLIVVPSRDDPTVSPSGGGAAAGGGSGGGAVLDLNQASADALDALPGIGPVTAAKIIASRTETPFASVNDLLSRKLVSQKVFDQIRTLVTVR